MKLAYLARTILWMGLSLLMPTAVMGQGAITTCDPPFPPKDDIWQRRVTFFNNTPHTVWPVITAPANDNCKDDRPPGAAEWRLHVNKDTKSAGIPSGAHVEVRLPKCFPCDAGGFYIAARAHVFLVHAERFEEDLKKRNQGAQATTPYRDPGRPTPPICSNDPNNDPCWVGTSQANYALDSPAQLVEWTIVSQDVLGQPNANPNDDRAGAVPFLDFDLSYVDHAYLPIAISTDTGGARFMGSSLSFEKFKERIASFVKEADWPVWAAYNSTNFKPDPGRTIFYHLLVENDPNPHQRIPSASQALAASDTSVFFNAKYNPDFPKVIDPITKQLVSYPTICNDTKAGGQNRYNLQCSEALPNNAECCPDSNAQTDENAMLGCCDIDKFIIDKVYRQYTPGPKPFEGTFRFFSKFLADITARFKKWLDPSPIVCGSAPPFSPVAPQLQSEFCLQFKRTVRYVWDEFKTQDGSLGDKSQCKSLRGDAFDQCVTRLIVGYVINTEADAKFKKD